MKKLLITGASGFLGWHLSRKALGKWIVFGVYRSRRVNMKGVTPIRADLTRYAEITKLMRTVKPDAVIHAAAEANPDRCQLHPDRSRQINVAASMHIAGLCADLDIPCVFTSSDLVFDGLNPPYSESDTPSPICIYGEQKIEAEREMKSRYPPTVICRMALMYGDPAPAAPGYLTSLVRAMTSEGGALLFTDQFRTPLWVKDAADGLLLGVKKRPNLLHLGGPERISRYAFGKRVAAVLKSDDIKITPCRKKDLSFPAPRASDVSFDISKACALGFLPRTVADALSSLRMLQHR